jgi:hypothetical protein
MKTNTDIFANLYYKPKSQKLRVRALLDGTALPHHIADLLQTAFQRYHENDDEAAAFYIIELCEAVKKHEAEIEG